MRINTQIAPYRPLNYFLMLLCFTEQNKPPKKRMRTVGTLTIIGKVTSILKDDNSRKFG